MEYERTDEGQIQTDFARRAGQLLLQYERLGQGLPAEEQYEATLAVALLQSMLTICQELLRRGSRRNSREGSGGGMRELANRFVLDEPALMGLEAECIVESWQSARGVTYREVFECLRNALSHPCPQGGTRYPVTGYTTLNSGSGRIEVFEFVQSSWVNKTGSHLLNKYAPSKTDTQAKDAIEGHVREWAKNSAVDGLHVRMDDDGKWRVNQGSNVFVPVLRLRLNVQQLRTFTLTLSDHLSAPFEQSLAEST